MADIPEPNDVQPKDLISNSTYGTFIVNITSSVSSEHLEVNIIFPLSSCQLALAFSIMYIVIGVLGNLLTIVALLRSRKLRGNVTNILVVNLAVADLVFCAFNLPLTATRYAHQAWIFGDALCKIFPVFFYGNLAVSLLSVLMITINRYVVIVHSHTYQRLFTNGAAAAMIAFCWLFATSMLLPTYFGVWGEFGLVPETFSCTFLEKDGKNAQPYLFLFGVGIPILIMIPCYAHIYVVVRRSRRLSPGKQTCSSRKRSEERVLAKMMVAVLLSFIACCAPVVIITFSVAEAAAPYLHVMASILTWTTSIVNPIIYAFMNKNYRHAYKSFLLLMYRPKVRPRWASSTRTTSSSTRVSTARNFTIDLTSLGISLRRSRSSSSRQSQKSKVSNRSLRSATNIKTNV